MDPQLCEFLPTLVERNDHLELHRKLIMWTSLFVEFTLFKLQWKSLFLSTMLSQSVGSVGSLSSLKATSVWPTIILRVVRSRGTITAIFFTYMYFGYFLDWSRMRGSGPKMCTPLALMPRLLESSAPWSEVPALGLRGLERTWPRSRMKVKFVCVPKCGSNNVLLHFWRWKSPMSMSEHKHKF